MPGRAIDTKVSFDVFMDAIIDIDLKDPGTEGIRIIRVREKRDD
jgi:hypothetical protein